MTYIVDRKTGFICFLNLPALLEIQEITIDNIDHMQQQLEQIRDQQKHSWNQFSPAGKNGMHL